MCCVNPLNLSCFSGLTLVVGRLWDDGAGPNLVMRHMVLQTLFRPRAILYRDVLPDHSQSIAKPPTAMIGGLQNDHRVKLQNRI